MAAFYYMITGVTKAETGSMDTYFTTKLNAANYNYAYLGCPTGSPKPGSDFTWNTGSLADTNQKDFQMYTPYPTSTTRGKLYWVTTSSYYSDGTIPNRDKFVNLEIPPANQYYIVTPSLNNASYQAAGQCVIAQYAFASEDDLWFNGWKSQNGLPGFSDPLATQANWNAVLNRNEWTIPPMSFRNDGTVAGDRAQIVANVLALTNLSYVLQNDIPMTPLIKGAIVLAGTGTIFSNSTYKNLVPLKNG
jgi:hypothetical protein